MIKKSKIFKTSWTRHENDGLLSLVRKHGYDLKKLVENFTGRTEMSIYGRLKMFKKDPNLIGNDFEDLK